jgi:hypothetical protein
LAVAVKLVDAIGTGRRRGLGHCKIEVEEILSGTEKYSEKKDIAREIAANFENDWIKEHSIYCDQSIEYSENEEKIYDKSNCVYIKYRIHKAICRNVRRRD